MKTAYIPAPRIKRETVQLIPSAYAFHNRAVQTSEGTFLIAENDHPTKRIGEYVCVVFDTDDQFATIVS